MSKHTPGPWKAVQHPREHKWAWTIEGADGVGQIIARMGLVNDAQAVAANARLIAAAPELLAALYAASEWLNDMGCEHEEPDLTCVVCLVNIAIDKAEGR